MYFKNLYRHERRRILTVLVLHFRLYRSFTINFVVLNEILYTAAFLDSLLNFKVHLIFIVF